MLIDRLVRFFLPRPDHFFVLLEELADKIDASAAVFAELEAAVGHDQIATAAQAQSATIQALAAASLPGLRESEIRAAAALQRLVIAVPELFSKRKPEIATGHDAVIDALAELIKKYPTYPVQIIGYTDNRGKASELLAISAARAQSVYSALAAKGVETRRLMASGLGGDDPRFDNKTAPGRAKNNRIEIVFLYH